MRSRVKLTVRLLGLLLPAALAACAGGGSAQWNGRRGYDGNGDYGYDVNASRRDANDYLAHAAGNYPVPGTPDDPWGPYVRDAAARYQVPEQWVRAVMQQESGGQLYVGGGALVTSPVGAMGLMQIMPQTWEMLRARYGVGSDPYEPHDNILAGTAYIREMYDRYGAPGFLAAYNAGPDRLDAYLQGGTPLPDETVNYLASITPNLGTQVAMTGPLAVYAGGTAAAYASNTVAYSGGSYNSGYSGSASGYANSNAAYDDGSAYEGGGAVAADTSAQAAPPPPSNNDSAWSGGTGVAAPPATVARYQSAAVTQVAAMPTAGGNWAVQVGAFPDASVSVAALSRARVTVGPLLANASSALVPVMRGQLLYRARLTGLSQNDAAATCARLSGSGLDCFTVPPGS
jgi:D-alanyl-D-alanine carboxypeptidase